MGKGEEVVAMPDFNKGHWTRSLTFDSKGEKFYLGIGSGSNVDTGENERRASILRCNPDGSGLRIVCDRNAESNVDLLLYQGRISFGHPFRSVTRWVTILCPTTSRISSKAAFTDGRTLTSGLMKIPVIKGKSPTW